MNNVIQFKRNTVLEGYYVEAKSEVIKIYQLQSDNKYHEQEAIPFADVARRLDEGAWDDKPALALKIITIWGNTINQLSDTDVLLTWRWLIASTFERELREKNGVVRVERCPDEFVDCAVYRSNQGAMNIYLSTERFAMANNIEAALIERFGVEQGTRNATQFYIMMRSEDGGLSDFGWEVLTEMHDGFLQQLNESGMPEAPTAH
ncbi:hypothetical protein EKN56_19790 [Limnobaculum zhutongyuii]|uniref:Uncharacterized protein n=1 Tax=Limnobaculum zhutongyuii TaxID=2498113 RepID=A0A411WR01_9GAMM|nr:hypothetical protein [Limnobaculum zhutongyuii]QBH98435.1 hypothetical protein EKN56_19790 [Limnobaculum zhutongyuii]TQS89667.1 hypothetical protein ELQ32_04450 [Limnobaculum zhutongyuii]